MKPSERDQVREKQMRASFDASLPHRLERAARVNLQNIIPAHWFAAAASECAGMYIAGFFYGAISVAQAYVEALSKFLAEHHRVPVRKDSEKRCHRLQKAGFLSKAAMEAAVAVLDSRNVFHHLNRDVPQQYRELQARAEQCINHLHTIESEVFAYSIEVPGQMTIHKPEYWPSAGPGLAQGRVRQLW